MKQILTAFLGLITFSLSLGAQEIEANHVEKRTIGAFHGVKTSSGIEVILKKGDKEELAVTASEQDILKEIKTEVSNGILKVSRNDNWKFWEGRKRWRVKVYVSYKSIDQLGAGSGGILRIDDLTADKVVADVSSGGGIYVNGKANALKVDASSGGYFRGYGFIVDMCNADASSGGGIQIMVNKEIKAEASSGGYIRYKGDAVIRDINVSSGGSVKKSAEKD